VLLREPIVLAFFGLRIVRVFGVPGLARAAMIRTA
jgi:hypothetical protein